MNELMEGAVAEAWSPRVRSVENMGRGEAKAHVTYEIDDAGRCSSWRVVIGGVVIGDDTASAPRWRRGRVQPVSAAVIRWNCS